MNKEAIEKVIAEKIAPRLAADGGGVELVKIDEASGRVHVKLTGACGCCPFSMMTLKSVVEEVLKQEFPEIKEVVSS